MSYTGRPKRVKGALRAGAIGRAEAYQDRPRLPWCPGHCPLWSQNGVLGSSLRGRIPQASTLSDLSRASWTVLAARGLACVFCDRRSRASTLGPGFHHLSPSLASAPQTSTSKTSFLRPEHPRSVRWGGCCRHASPEQFWCKTSQILTHGTPPSSSGLKLGKAPAYPTSLPRGRWEPVSIYEGSEPLQGALETELEPW